MRLTPIFTYGIPLAPPCYDNRNDKRLHESVNKGDFVFLCMWWCNGLVFLEGSHFKRWRVAVNPPPRDVQWNQMELLLNQILYCLYYFIILDHRRLKKYIKNERQTRKWVCESSPSYEVCVWVKPQLWFFCTYFKKMIGGKWVRCGQSEFFSYLWIF